MGRYDYLTGGPGGAAPSAPKSRYSYLYDEPGPEGQEEPGLLSRGLHGVASVLGAPKAGVDWLARQSARAMGLPVSDEATTGSMLRSVVGLEQGDEGYAGKLGGRALEFATDVALDPLTYAGLGFAGKAGKVASGALAGTMGLGALEEGKQAYQTIQEEGFSPEAAEQVLGTALSAGMAGLAGSHALRRSPRPIQEPARAPEPAPRPGQVPVDPTARPSTSTGPVPYFDAPPPMRVPAPERPVPEAPPVVPERPFMTESAPDADAAADLSQSGVLKSEPLDRLEKRAKWYQQRGMTASAEMVQAEIQARQGPSEVPQAPLPPETGAPVATPEAAPIPSVRPEQPTGAPGTFGPDATLPPPDMGPSETLPLPRGPADTIPFPGKTPLELQLEESIRYRQQIKQQADALADLGWEPSQIRELTPEAVEQIIANGERPSYAPDGQRAMATNLGGVLTSGVQRPVPRTPLVEAQERAIAESGVENPFATRPVAEGSAPREAATEARGPEPLPEVEAPLAEGGIRYSAQPNRQGFYSQLRRVVDDTKQPAASGQQWSAYLRDQKRGVKAEEMKWTGLDDYLKERTGQKVTRQEIQEFLDQNEVQVEEVTKGAVNATTVRENEMRLRELDAERNANGGQLLPHERTVEQNRRIRDIEDEAQRLENLSSRAAGDTKFGQYQLPGGENYRELLLTLPRKTPVSFEDWYAQTHVRPFAELSEGGQRLARQQYAREGQNINAASDFRSGHFDEPNILAHVRFNERTDADGKRVLFIEEVQSDWAQKGRREGFDTQDSLARREAAQREVQAAREELESIKEESRRLTRLPNPVRPRPEWGRADSHLAQPWEAAETRYSEAIRALRETGAPGEYVSAKSGVPSAPFVGKTEAWSELAMKRMVRWAAENGFDRVAWTKGEQQAARYDLSKHVDQVEWTPWPAAGKDHGILVARKGGEEVIKQTIPQSKLPDHIGKDVAERLLQEPKDQGGRQILAGEGLKVGGQGMLGFYDQILPAVAGKLGKKFGARVGEADLATGETTKNLDQDAIRAEATRHMEEGDIGAAHLLSHIARAREVTDAKSALDRMRGDNLARYGVTPESFRIVEDYIQQNSASQVFKAHSLDITPEMRQSVMQGQPLFRATDAPTVPGVTTETIRKAFAAGGVKEAGTGAWDVHLPNDRIVRVRVRPDGIEYNAEAFQKGYSRPKAEAEQIVGAWQPVDRGGIVWLAKEADQGTVHHEAFHGAMDMALSPSEKAAVLKRYGSEEAAAEAYAKWEPKTVNSWFSKILQFFRNMYRTFRPSWESAFERTRSGEAYGGEGAQGARGERYSAAESVPERFRLRKPIAGPTGSKIVGYEWRSAMGEKFSEREGGMVKARVSDWDRKDTSSGTGRDIVHLFYVERPDGSITTEGVGSARNILGLETSRLRTIADNERTAQRVREKQQREYAEATSSQANTPAEAARTYLMGNQGLSARGPEEVFPGTVLLEKGGKYIRATRENAQALEQFGGWARSANDPLADRPWMQQAPTAPKYATATPVAPQAPAQPTQAKLPPKPTLADMFFEGWKSGLVSAPGTQLANPVSNIGEAGVRSAEAALAGLIDKALGGQRTRFSGEAVEQIKGAFGRIPDAAQELADGLKKAATLKATPNPQYPPAIPGKAGRAVRIPLELLGVGDRTTGVMNEGAVLRALAYRQARKQLPNGSRVDIEALRDQIIQNPSQGLRDAVKKEVDSRQFRAEQDPDSLISFLKKMRSEHKWLNIPLPFLETPGNIAKLAIQRSPYGFGKAWKAYRAYKDAIGKATPDQLAELKGDAVDAISRPLLGTTLLGLFGAYAQAGGMTGSGPADPKAVALKKQTGWQPYSFVIPDGQGGRTYIPFNRFEPVSSMLGFAADMAEAKDQKSASDIFEKALGSIASNLTSKTYLQGLGDAAAMIARPKEFAGQYVSNLAGSLVPNVVAKATQALDPTVRDTTPQTKGWTGIPERAGRSVMARIPGLAAQLPERKTATGETYIREGNALTRFGLPVQVTSDKPSRDLEAFLVEIGAVPGQPSRDFNVPGQRGKSFRLSPTEYAVLQEGNKRAAEVLRRHLAAGRLQRLSPEDAKKAVEGIFQDERRKARERLMMNRGFRQRIVEARASA